MHTSQLLTALAAAGFATAQTKTCSKNIKITEPTPVIDCDVVAADIIVDSGVGGALSIEGPKQIKGDLILKNVSITAFSSSSINAISGKLELDGLEFLDTLTLSSLTDVGEIRFVNLNRLGGVTFGSSGVTKVKTIEISDTFIDDLSGLNVATVENFKINNNKRMKTFNSDLVNITGTDGLQLQGNGVDMELELNQLEIASELQFQDVKSIKFSALTEVTASLNIIQNENLKSIAAPNLTEVGNSLALRFNDKLTNVSFPQLTKIGGGLILVNNTNLETVSGFPKLETVEGGLNLTGIFEEVKLPELKDVKGSSIVSSTTDIKDFCEFFEDAKSKGDIQGEAECTFNNKDALKGDTDGGEKADGSGSSDDSSDDSGSSDEDDAAGILNVNMAVLGLALVFGVAQLL
jgi:hypothetical protein